MMFSQQPYVSFRSMLHLFQEAHNALIVRLSILLLFYWLYKTFSLAVLNYTLSHFYPVNMQHSVETMAFQ